MKHINHWPKVSVTDGILLFTSGLMSTLLGLVLPFSILIIFDRVIPNTSTSTLYFIFLIIIIAVFFDYKIKNLEDIITSRIGNRFEKNVTNRLFEATCHADLNDFKKINTGEYLERLTTVIKLRSFFSGDIIKAIINTLTSIITLIIISIINPTSGLILVVSSLFLLVIAIHLSNDKILLLKQKIEIEGLTNSNIMNIISSPLNIKGCSMEYRLENLMATMLDEREVCTSQFEKKESKFALTLGLIQQLTVVMVVVSCATAVINLNISQGVMAAVILLTNRFFGPYQQVMRSLSQWGVNKNHIQRLNDILAIASKQHSIASIDTPNSIYYQGRFNYLFPASKISIMSGLSGSGKSSILRAFINKKTSNEYNISMNNLMLENHDEINIINNSILIDKDSRFVDGTIIDNITCFRPQMHKAAYSLCEALNIKHDLNDLKLGFYTEITASGIKPFSRKISFALLIIRALLSNKKIILIDDFDLSFDKKFSNDLLTCLRPRVHSYLFIIVSNKIIHNDPSIQHIKAREVI